MMRLRGNRLLSESNHHSGPTAPYRFLAPTPIAVSLAPPKNRMHHDSLAHI